VARLVTAALAGSAGLWVVLRLGGAPVPFVLLLGAVAAVLATLRLVRAVHGPPAPPPLPLAAADPRPGDRPFVDAALWEDRLAWADGDAGQFDRTVRPVIARVADERLRQRHGVRLHQPAGGPGDPTGPGAPRLPRAPRRPVRAGPPGASHPGGGPVGPADLTHRVSPLTGRAGAARLPAGAGVTTAPALTVAEASGLAARVLDQVQRAVVGKRRALELVLAGVLAGGHVLLEDFPGLGKTLAARSFAQALGIGFRRLQFTPDLLPADITGSYLYDQRSADFVFRPGPLFTDLLLADEVNRTPPKTQAALLEAMQERQVSVEGTTYALGRPFHVLATANPIEYEGTYPLPEAQLDRFLLRVSFGYPGRDDEWDVLRRRMARRQEEIELDAVVDGPTLLAMQGALEDVAVEESVGRYVVDLTAATRAHPQVLVGASPRGALALLLCARAQALLAGRDFVVPEDVQAVAVAALAHRVSLRPEMWLRRVEPADVVAGLLAEVPVPASGAMPGYGGR